MTENKLRAIVKALDDKKATDIVVIDISNKIPMFDYYVIATGSSSRQLNGFASATEEAVEKMNEHIHHIEGQSDSGWIVVDANDIIVHLFDKETREQFKFDQLFENEEHVDVTTLLK